MSIQRIFAPTVEGNQVESPTGISERIGWHYGDGPPPDIIVGAAVGDAYLDRLTGYIYILE